MRSCKILTLSVASLALLLTSVLAQNTGGARQQYGPWQINKEKGYHYRKFEYKASPTDKEYKHEYVIYYKEDPKKEINNNWVYFYNPMTEKFWAHYPTTNHPTYGKDAKAGKEVWSVLPGKARQKDIYQIDTKQWPTPPADFCPPVPTSSDSINLMSPPSDLP